MTRSVSVVVINFNSVGDLPRCLDAILAQDHEKLELIIIDNESTDGSADWIRTWLAATATRFPIRFFANAKNNGFAGAINQGIRESSGDLVLSLNPDAVMEPAFVRNLARRFDEPGVGSASGRLIRFPLGGAGSNIDSVGHAIFTSRQVNNIGDSTPAAGNFTEPAEIWGTSGAAGMYSRAMLEDVAVFGEYFDEDFFAYREDIDLDWRARIRGWRCVYEPSAIAYHRRGAAHFKRSISVERHAIKNQYLLLLKNDTPARFLRALPHVLRTETRRTLWTLMRCPGAVLGLADVVTYLPRTLAKRRVIQSRRVVSARDLEAWFGPPRYDGRLVDLPKEALKYLAGFFISRMSAWVRGQSHA